MQKTRESTAKRGRPARRPAVKSWLHQVTGILLEDIPDGDPPGLYDLVSAYPSRPAKSLRPALCLATCEALGGDPGRAVNTAVLSSVNAARFLPFNPFTGTPVQGPRPASGTGTTNWDFARNADGSLAFGTARDQFDYQLPRTFTVAAGVRF